MYKLGMTKIEELIKNIYNKTRKFFLINFFKKKILSSIKLDVIENNSFGYVAKSDFQEFKNEEYFSKFLVKNTNQITESQNLLLLNKNNYIHRDILINLY